MIKTILKFVFIFILGVLSGGHWYYLLSIPSKSSVYDKFLGEYLIYADKNNISGKISAKDCEIEEEKGKERKFVKWHVSCVVQVGGQTHFFSVAYNHGGGIAYKSEEIR